MKAKFIGDPNDDGSGPRVLRMSFGPTPQSQKIYLFPLNQFVGVPESVGEKLQTNNHFEVENGDAPAYDGPVEPTRAEREKAGRAEKGSAKGKDELLERLAALKAEHPEIEFDAKWGAPKLRGVLEEAEFVYGDD